MTSRPSHELLEDLERRHGDFRLDKRPFPSDHGDIDWTRRVFGSGVDGLLPESRRTTLTMFDFPPIVLLTNAASPLLGSWSALLEDVPVGMTSIPILNACAIRRGEARVIGLNNRLCNALYFANGVMWQPGEVFTKGQNPGDDKISRIKAIIRGGSVRSFDDVLASGPPIGVNCLRLGAQWCNIQLLFILLHEYGHIACGHHRDARHWGAMPFDEPGVLQFNGDIKCEFEADEFAARHLFNRTAWPAVPEEMILLSKASDRQDAVVPAAVVQLMMWLSLLVPGDRKTYYRVSRSHPHPLERAERIVDLVKAFGSQFNCARLREAVEVQQRLYVSQD